MGPTTSIILFLLPNKDRKRVHCKLGYKSHLLILLLLNPIFYHKMASLPKLHSFGKRRSVQANQSPKDKPRVVTRTLSSSSFSIMTPATKMRRRISTFLNGSISISSTHGSPEQSCFKGGMFLARQNQPEDSSDGTSTTSSESDHPHSPSTEIGGMPPNIRPHAVSPVLKKQPQDVWCVHQDIWVVSPPNYQSVTPHTNPTETVGLQLAQQVSRVLGSVVADVDEEIDKEWEISRAALSWSLSHC
ncbi:hypothetical protein CLU79DRAFT_543622 [Phycomyces nitens]|nr:hypothetical protein CLU79DRAFT_543622 [Phycomyces nitens]